MTFTQYVVAWAVGAALTFILIWLDRQWEMSKNHASSALDFGPAMMMTLFWPFMLIIGTAAGIWYVSESLWTKQILFKKKEKKVCPFKGNPNEA